MPSEFDRKVRLNFKGVDQSRDSHLLNDSSWENCEGFRPYHGTMESLPQVVKNYGVLQIRSNPSSSIKVMEPVYDQSTDSFSYLCLTERQAWLQSPDALLQTSGTAAQSSEQTEIPILLKTASVTTSGDYTAQCLVTGFNTTNEATDYPDIGDTIEVEIQSATTFKITSSVSGVLGTGLTIAREVPISGTDYSVYFYDPDSLFTGYNVGDTWTYTRSELPYDSSYNEAPFNRVSYAYDLYIVLSDRSILRYRDGVLSSVGYEEAIKGEYVDLWANKLIVGKFGATAEDRYRIGWSDLNDPDLFYQEVNNEAGEINLLSTFDSSLPSQGVTGLKSYLNLIYAYFPSAIHRGTYVGLSSGTIYWNQLRADIGCAFPMGPIMGRGGHYFIGTDLNFYLNDGNQVITIGDKVRDKFREEIVPRTSTNYLKTWGFYNDRENEVTWCYYWVDDSGNERLKSITYMEDSGDWYFQKLPTNTTDENASEIATVSFALENLSRKHWGAENYFYIDFEGRDCRVEDLLAEDVGTSTDAEETIADGVEVVVAEGDEWIIPVTTPATAFVLTTQDILYTPSRTHELESFWFDAGWTQAKSITIESSLRDRTSAPISWTELGEWTPELANQIFDEFTGCEDGKVFKYRFTLNPDESSGLVYKVFIKMWSDNIRGQQLELER